MTQNDIIRNYAQRADCDWNILRAMMSTLSSADLNELSFQADEPIIGRAVNSIAYQRSPSSNTANPHYLSVKTLLANYHTKGKRMKARKELQTRLPYLSYVEQKQVLTTFLHDCRLDRDWALKFLFNHWDARFEKDVIRIFEWSRSNASARVICKWGSPKYISAHLEELSEADSYLHARLRLPADAPIDIDQCHYEYLYLAAKLHLKVPRVLAYNIMMKDLGCILASCTQKYDEWHPTYQSLSEITKIKHLIWCLGELKQFEILQWFAHVNETTKPMIAANDVPAIMKELGL
ncbi:MAG: hypothetical protein MJZ20_14305 [Bacteroidaceae bacterium]|nr:hypothetical protein [Bacteroidaceae bacterium]